MTDEDVRAALARAEAATPGPWWVGEALGVAGRDVLVCAGGWWIAEWRIPSRANAEFAAAARTDVPALAAEVLRLREALRTIAGRSGCDCYYAPCDHDTARAALGEP